MLKLNFLASAPKGALKIDPSMPPDLSATSR